MRPIIAAWRRPRENHGLALLQGDQAANTPLASPIAHSYGGKVHFASPPFRRRRRRNVEPQTAAALLSEVIGRLGGKERALEQRIFAVWETAVGTGLARRALPESVRGKTLLVRVESSAFAHELTLLKRTVIERLALTLGPNLVTDLRTRVGP
jgi:predicted nucleic acid-binding Zn ribbon protein